MLFKIKIHKKMFLLQAKLFGTPFDTVINK